MSALTRWINRIRITAYALGLLGLAAVLAGRRMEGSAHTWLVGIGAGCMAVMFGLFLVSYILYTISLFRR